MTEQLGDDPGDRAAMMCSIFIASIHSDGLALVDLRRRQRPRTRITVPGIGTSNNPSTTFTDGPAEPLPLARPRRPSPSDEVDAKEPVVRCNVGLRVVARSP